MKTITHKVDERGVQYATVHFSEGRDYGFRSSQYALGWCKPNYPMPAIRLEVDYLEEVTGEIVACLLFDVSVRNVHKCVGFWH